MLLLSIHPRFVERIFEGTKTVELRKRRPRVELGSKVVIYSTMPDCKITGYATISAIDVCSPSKLWSKVRLSCGVTRGEFDLYYGDAQTSVGIHLLDPVLLDRGLSLSKLRKLWPGFHPPQQYQYLAEVRQEALFATFGTFA